MNFILIKRSTFLKDYLFNFFWVTDLTLYSVDSAGVVIAWNCHTHEQPKKDSKTSWSLKTVRHENKYSFYCVKTTEKYF